MEALLEEWQQSKLLEKATLDARVLAKRHLMEPGKSLGVFAPATALFHDVGFEQLIPAQNAMFAEEAALKPRRTPLITSAAESPAPLTLPSAPVAPVIVIRS